MRAITPEEAQQHRRDQLDAVAELLYRVWRNSRAAVLPDEERSKWRAVADAVLTLQR